MPSFNTVIIVGNLTRDIEVRYTPKGTAVANAGLAINRNWTTESGEKKESVTFVDVSMFGRTAENCAQYLKKGNPALVSGRLETQSWDDKQTGQKRSKLVIIAETVQFLGSANESGQRSTQQSSPPQPKQTPAAQSSTPPSAPVAGDGPRDGDGSDDVPF